MSRVLSSVFLCVRGESLGVKLLWSILRSDRFVDDDFDYSTLSGGDWACLVACTLSRCDLADAIGCSRVSLWRWLARLEELGLVRIVGKKILVNRSVESDADWGSVVGEVRTEAAGVIGNG